MCVTYFVLVLSKHVAPPRCLWVRSLRILSFVLESDPCSKVLPPCRVVILRSGVAIVDGDSKGKGEQQGDGYASSP